MEWFALGRSGQRTSVKCAEAAWNYKVRERSALKITCVFKRVELEGLGEVMMNHPSQPGQPPMGGGDIDILDVECRMTFYLFLSSPDKIFKLPYTVSAILSVM